MKAFKGQAELNIYKVVVFDRSMPPELQERLNDKKIQSVNQSNCTDWWLYNGDFVSGDWNKVLPFVISAPCQTLFLANNIKEDIIIDISKPYFCALKSLMLACNNISSIEQLQFMNIPNLVVLNLFDNKISNLKALNKCNWNSLQDLSLNKNSIQQISFERLKILMKTQIQSQNNKKQLSVQSIGQNENFTAKLAFNKISLKLALKISPYNPLKKTMQRKSMEIIISQ